VLAALGDVITKENMDQVQAKMILELANGPVSEEADDYLTKNGVIIIPDIIANAGGVIVSYIELLQNRKGEQWSEGEVNKHLERYLVEAINTVFDHAATDKTSLKEAAFKTAIHRILGARRKA
jgi:glutamate dehydrogenase/leucine dehydrogenase